MNFHLPRLLFRLLLLSVITLPVLAAEELGTPAQQADWEQRLEKAAALQSEGQAKINAADALLEQTLPACDQKFLVISCQKDANKAHLESVRPAKRLVNQGKAMEREVKKEQLAEKDKNRAERAKAREAELKVLEAETSAERQAAINTEAAKRADKAKKAEEGSQLRAERLERQRKKAADHEAKVAAKKAQAARRAAEAETKQP